MYRKSAHTTYDLKYHIIWCTKYRYRVLTGEVAKRVRELVREICAANYIEIISGSLSPDHVHILASIPPNISLSKVMQYVKGKSSRKIMMEFEHLRKKYWGQHIWARGYFAVTVGNLNEQEVQEYIESQELHHQQDNFSISQH
jgi:putative transposase